MEHIYDVILTYKVVGQISADEAIRVVQERQRMFSVTDLLVSVTINRGYDSEKKQTIDVDAQVKLVGIQVGE